MGNRILYLTYLLNKNILEFKDNKKTYDLSVYSTGKRHKISQNQTSSA
jgi:hypothetical protein